MELSQRKSYAETEYDNYRKECQEEIGQLIEVVREKEVELAQLQSKLDKVRGNEGEDEEAEKV